MSTVPSPPVSDAKKTIRNPEPGWGAMRGALASEIGSLGTVPMAILLLCEVVKCQGISGARKEPAVSIALERCVKKHLRTSKNSTWMPRTGPADKTFFVLPRTDIHCEQVADFSELCFEIRDLMPKHYDS